MLQVTQRLFWKVKPADDPGKNQQAKEENIDNSQQHCNVVQEGPVTGIALAGDRKDARPHN